MEDAVNFMQRREKLNDFVKLLERKEYPRIK
jgi:hypothetical protein